MNNSNRIYATSQEISEINKEIDHIWMPDDGPCPYCSESKECEHWRGHGWAKDGEDELTKTNQQKPKEV